MSAVSIAAYYPWSRVVILGQSVSTEADLAVLDVRPDQRFKPLCSRCGGAASRTCSHHVRAVRVVLHRHECLLPPCHLREYI